VYGPTKEGPAAAAGHGGVRTAGRRYWGIRTHTPCGAARGRDGGIQDSKKQARAWVCGERYMGKEIRKETSSDRTQSIHEHATDDWPESAQGNKVSPQMTVAGLWAWGSKKRDGGERRAYKLSAQPGFLKRARARLRATAWSTTGLG